MAELKNGVHRAIARDGTVALLIVASGRIVECVQVGRTEPSRPSRRWVASSLEVLRERAERRRLEAMMNALRADAEGQRYVPERGEAA